MDVDSLIEKTMNCTPLSELQIMKICKTARELFAKENNIVNLSTPISLVGDIHGQFWDFRELLKIAKKVGEGRFLFLGDYVDRGKWSVEMITLLFLYKIKFPDQVTLLRGNHETREISGQGGFLTECQTKYGDNSNVWKFFNDAFDYLPYAALIDGKVFCVHGGISPQMVGLDQLRALDRLTENTFNSIVSDLMWSDPDPNIENFKFSPRGEGFMYGETALTAFLNYNSLQFICRAHQLAHNGFMKFWDGKAYTVWSAPNYCYRFHNAASVMEIDDRLNHEFKIFYECKDEHARPDFKHKSDVKLSEYFE